MNLLSAVLQEANKVTTEEQKRHREDVLPKIKDLTDRVQMLSWALQQNFIDTYLTFTVTKSLEQLNYKNRKANIDSDFQEITEELKTLEQQFHVIDDELNDCHLKMIKCYKTLKDLCIAVEGNSTLASADHEFGRCNYCTAMLSIIELKLHLKGLNFEGNLVKALRNLNEQAENQLALYTAHVSIEWEDIFKWSEKKGLRYLSYSLTVQQSDPELLKTILKTLYATQRINAELGLFSHFFIEQLLHNVIRHNCDIFTEDYIGAIVFNIKIDLNDKKKPNYQTIFNNLTAVFEFLQSTLGSHFESDCSFIEVFAQSISKKFFNKIIEDCIRHNLPSCKSSYEHYKNIVLELEAFNKFLVDIKFTAMDESPLNKYIDDTECVLYNKKCDKLLSDVRDLLNESLSLGTLVVGTDSEADEDFTNSTSEKDILWDLNKPVFLAKCIVSQNVKTILTMITEHLEESAKLPEKYSNQLICYIKDIAVMYQCVVPKKFKVNLEYCPADIALFFNNCFYLAHGLMGPPWRCSLPARLAGRLAAATLECIQDLRTLGLEKMSLYLQKQKSIIVQSLEFEDSFTWTHDTYERYDCAINSAVSLMHELHARWARVLPARMYVAAQCALVASLCRAAVGAVFSSRLALAEDLAYMLASRLADAQAEINTLFDEPINFAAKINVWSKFTTLPRLLKAQLLEISDLWNNHRDECQSYTCEEIRQIVKMRFPDDKYRLKILKEIQ